MLQKISMNHFNKILNINIHTLMNNKIPPKPNSIEHNCSTQREITLHLLTYMKKPMRLRKQTNKDLQIITWELLNF